jgi:hypothetical protein
MASKKRTAAAAEYDEEPEFKPRGLCFRCEYRVAYNENGRTGFAPRCECRDENSSKAGCYQFSPVHPVTVEPDKSDKRSIYYPAMIRPRMYVSKKQTPMEVVLNDAKGNRYTPYWKPK